MATSTVIVLASRFAAPVVESIKLSRSIVCTPIVLFSTAILSNLFSIIFVNVPITLVESSSFFYLPRRIFPIRRGDQYVLLPRTRFRSHSRFCTCPRKNIVPLSYIRWYINTRNNFYAGCVIAPSKSEDVWGLESKGRVEPLVRKCLCMVFCTPKESHCKSPFLRKCKDQSQQKLYPVAPTTATKFKTMLDLLKRDSMQNEKYFYCARSNGWSSSVLDCGSNEKFFAFFWTIGYSNRILPLSFLNQPLSSCLLGCLHPWSK